MEIADGEDRAEGRIGGLSRVDTWVGGNDGWTDARVREACEK